MKTDSINSGENMGIVVEDDSSNDLNDCGLNPTNMQNEDSHSEIGEAVLNDIFGLEDTYVAKDISIVGGNASSNDLNDCGLCPMNMGENSLPQIPDGDCPPPGNPRLENDCDKSQGLPLTSGSGSKAEPIEGSNSDEKLPRKKSLFDMRELKVEVGNIDHEGWRTKPPELWGKRDSMNWLLWAAIVLGQAYGQTSPRLAMPGNELLRLEKQDFIKYDPHFGKKLHDLLHKGRASNSSQSSQVPSSELIEMDTEDETFAGSDDDSSDGESVVGSDSPEEPQYNRPPLPIFIKKLLFDQNHSEYICWKNYEEKSFRFIQGDKVAELWGKLNGKTDMNYKNFTRAIRYYYDSEDKDNGIFAPDPERRVYRFGRKATELLAETGNANVNDFEHRIMFMD